MITSGGYCPETNPAFVYITAGFTDLTEKITYGWDGNHYQEVVFYEDMTKAAERVMGEYRKSSHFLL